MEMPIPPLALSSENFDWRQPGAPAKLFKLAGENDVINRNGRINGANGGPTRITWTVRAYNMTSDPTKDYSFDIPHGAVVWMKKSFEKSSYENKVRIEFQKGKYHTTDLSIFQVLASTPVLNMLLFRLSRESLVTPDYVNANWTAAGVASSDLTETTGGKQKDMTLDVLHTIRILNMWSPEVVAGDHLFMGIVAVKPQSSNNYVPHSTTMQTERFTNLNTQNQLIPYVVQVLPFVSCQRVAPKSAVSTRITKPDGSHMTIMGHAAHIAEVRYRDTRSSSALGPLKTSYYNNFSVMRLDTCTNMMQLRTTTMIEALISVD